MARIINQAQDFPEWVSRYCHLGQLERDVPAMADNLGVDLDQLLPLRGQWPVLELLGEFQCLLLAISGSYGP